MLFIEVIAEISIYPTKICKMKKGLLFLLMIFVFQSVSETIGFTKFQKNQGSEESSQKTEIVPKSFFGRPFNLPSEALIEENNFLETASMVGNQFNDLESSVYLTEIQLNQQFDSSVTFQNQAQEQKVLGKQNDQIQNFDLETGFLIKVPLWLIGLLCLFVIYTIFISLKFFSIYFQEVSTQEQLEVITGDFDSYKRNTIEKERKLMRDLIDARNRINELSQD